VDGGFPGWGFSACVSQNFDNRRSFEKSRPHSKRMDLLVLTLRLRRFGTVAEYRLDHPQWVAQVLRTFCTDGQPYVGVSAPWRAYPPLKSLNTFLRRRPAFTAPTNPGFADLRNAWKSIHLRSPPISARFRRRSGSNGRAKRGFGVYWYGDGRLSAGDRPISSS